MSTSKPKQKKRRGIVFYIDVRKINPSDVSQYVRSCGDSLYCEDESHYLVAVERETSVELLWTDYD